MRVTYVSNGLAIAVGEFKLLRRAALHEGRGGVHGRGIAEILHIEVSVPKKCGAPLTILDITVYLSRKGLHDDVRANTEGQRILLEDEREGRRLHRSRTTTARRRHAYSTP